MTRTLPIPAARALVLALAGCQDPYANDHARPAPARRPSTSRRRRATPLDRARRPRRRPQLQPPAERVAAAGRSHVRARAGPTGTGDRVAASNGRSPDSPPAGSRSSCARTRAARGSTRASRATSPARAAPSPRSTSTAAPRRAAGIVVTREQTYTDGRADLGGQRYRVYLIRLTSQPQGLGGERMGAAAIAARIRLPRRTLAPTSPIARTCLRRARRSARRRLRTRRAALEPRRSRSRSRSQAAATSTAPVLLTEADPLGRARRARGHARRRTRSLSWRGASPKTPPRRRRSSSSTPGLRLVAARPQRCAMPEPRRRRRTARRGARRARTRRRRLRRPSGPRRARSSRRRRTSSGRCQQAPRASRRRAPCSTATSMPKAGGAAEVMVAIAAHATAERERASASTTGRQPLRTTRPRPAQRRGSRAASASSTSRVTRALTGLAPSLRGRR